jgi:hypothetical protein
MNDYIRKCHALLVLRNAYRKILESKKHNEGTEIMYRKIIQLDKELKIIDMNTEIGTKYKLILN